MHDGKSVRKGPSRMAKSSGDYRRFAYLGFVTIAISFGGFGSWAMMAPLDSAAIAPAQVAVETSRKPIQHLEGGIAREILVKEGDRVSADQVLFRLEPTQARANAQLLRKQLDAALGQEARLVAEEAHTETIAFPASLSTRRDMPDVEAVIIDQKRQFDERRRSMTGQMQILEARIRQIDKDVAARKSQLAAIDRQLESMLSEYQRIKPLSERGLFPVNKRVALEREQIRLAGEQGARQQEIEKSEETSRETQLQIEQLTHSFREEVAQQLAEVRVRLSDLRQKLLIADDVLTRLEIRAPREGIVQNVKVYSQGAVVRPGETIAELIPTDDMLVLSARIAPIDIDSIAQGQKAQIKFPSFSTRSTPPIFGKVDTVSADALIDETTKQPYFRAQVMVDMKHMPKHLAKRMVPGMPADVIITTGERTMMAYLMGPLTDAFSRGFREK
ncbi:MAG: HlyD family type I secretion periplasmic adaptor subunit [Hyphomicrobiaceae bacterium]